MAAALLCQLLPRLLFVILRAAFSFSISLSCSLSLHCSCQALQLGQTPLPVILISQLRAFPAEHPTWGSPAAMGSLLSTWTSLLLSLLSHLEHCSLPSQLMLPCPSWPCTDLCHPVVVSMFLIFCSFCFYYILITWLEQRGVCTREQGLQRPEVIGPLGVEATGHCKPPSEGTGNGTGTLEGAVQVLTH